MNSFIEGAITIAMAIIGLAMLSVLVSRKSNTTGVIQASASGFGNSLGVAMSPVTGAAYNIDLGYPNSGMGSSFAG